MIVVTVFLTISNQMDFHLVQNRKENCHHDHIPFNVKGIWSIVFSVYWNGRRIYTPSWSLFKHLLRDMLPPINLLFHSNSRVFIVFILKHSAHLFLISEQSLSKYYEEMFTFSQQQVYNKFVLKCVNLHKFQQLVWIYWSKYFIMACNCSET